MKIKYNGKEYDTQVVGDLILSLDGRLVFGKVGQPLMCGEEVTEVVTDEAPQDESA